MSYFSKPDHNLNYVVQYILYLQNQLKEECKDVFYNTNKKAHHFIKLKNLKQFIETITVVQNRVHGNFAWIKF